MYLTIIFLPLLASIISGFFGRKVGIRGAQIISCSCIIITTLLGILIFFEVGMNNIPVTIKLFRWIDLEYLSIDWGFNFDSLTVSMLLPVLIISCLVHLYSIGYMSHDPHQQRFFSYLSLFTFMMIILVTADNFLLMFVGWEGVGVCSYLLVNFWFTRIAANQSSLAAFFTNRVGDCFLTIGLFVLLLTFGNMDYFTVFSLAPYISENIITIIGICLLVGAMAKSSQIGLHVWLPMAMEGPTPVSALIHAATMVNCCRWLPWVNQIWYRYVLVQPYIKFIYILNLLNKINKKILCFIIVHFCNGVYRKRIFFIKKVNQQKTLLSNLVGFTVYNFFNFFTPFKKQEWKNKKYSKQQYNIINNKGYSETTCDITYNFEQYSNLIPQQKKNININFLEWFIGFTEGDGSFIISKKKVYFDITQKLNDVQVLYYIKKQLGFGKILFRHSVSEKDRNRAVFYVTSKENFTRLIAIFNGNLSTKNKKEQFKVWLDTYNKQYNMNILFKDKLVKPNLFSGWISGFTDAEGCFYGRVKSCLTSKLKKAPHLTFQVSQKEIYIIKIIRDIFLVYKSQSNFNEVGHFVTHSVSKGQDLKNIYYDKNWEGWTFHCSSFIKLKLIRNYFLRYKLKTRKSLAFKKWCKIHDMVLNKEHLELKGLKKIDILTKDINKYIS